MMGLEIVVVAVLILVNGFLAMSEFAVVFSRRSRLQSLVRRGNRGAGAAIRIGVEPTRFLSTIQIGITLVGILAGAFGGRTLADRLAGWLGRWPVAAEHAESIALAITVLIITYASLVIGELVPKRIALSRPERIASIVAPAMERLGKVAGPAVWLLKSSTEAVLRPFRLGGRPESSVTEDEVRALIAEGTRAGVFVPREREMIDGVLRLADRRVSAILTPRQDVVWLDSRAGPEEVTRTIAGTRYSRIPVCQGSLDNPIGIVHAKDLVSRALAGEPIDLGAAALEPIVVPERLPVLKLLDLFRREGLHMAIVVNEYGSTEGVVTANDILECITGGLPEIGAEESPGLFRRKDGSWLVDGGLPVDVFEHSVGVRGLKEAGEFETMGGFVLQRLGRFPEIGDRFEALGGAFEIVDIDGRRVDTILYTPSG